MRLIAERLLPSEQHGHVYVQGEIGNVALSPPPLTHARTYHLYCSKYNAGADEVSEELRELVNANASASKRARASFSRPSSLRATSDLKDLDRSEHFLLYLNRNTWTSTATREALAYEVWRALRAGVPLLLVHELPSMLDDGSSRGACAFNDFWNDDWTPKHLLKGAANIYKTIAIPLKPGDWRKAGLASVVMKMAQGGGVRAPVDVAMEGGSVRDSLMARRSLNGDRTSRYRPSSGEKGRSRRWDWGSWKTLPSKMRDSECRSAANSRRSHLDDVEGGEPADGYRKASPALPVASSRAPPLRATTAGSPTGRITSAGARRAGTTEAPPRVIRSSAVGEGRVQCRRSDARNSALVKPEPLPSPQRRLSVGCVGEEVQDEEAADERVFLRLSSCQRSSGRATAASAHVRGASGSPPASPVQALSSALGNGLHDFQARLGAIFEPDDGSGGQAAAEDRIAANLAAARVSRHSRTTRVRI